MHIISSILKGVQWVFSNGSAEYSQGDESSQFQTCFQNGSIWDGPAKLWGKSFLKLISAAQAPNLWLSVKSNKNYQSLFVPISGSGCRDVLPDRPEARALYNSLAESAGGACAGGKWTNVHPTRARLSGAAYSSLCSRSTAAPGAVLFRAVVVCIKLNWRG